MLSPPRRVTLLFALALVVGGGVLAAAQFERLAAYESTTGTVQTDDIRIVSNDTFDGATGAPQTLYGPNVSYTYTVDGERYTGANVASGDSMVMEDRDQLSAALADVDTGMTTVYYHPDEPGDAHLLRHFDFAPAGILLMCGFLAMADTLTPEPRIIRFVTSLVPIETLERLPVVNDPAMAQAVDDPMAVLSAKQQWTGTDAAPFRGGAGDAIWLFSYLLITDLVVGYYLLSQPPYDLWAVAAVLVVFAGLARLVYKRVVG